ncbi:unnamed protein product [Camellia sinensis]
MNGRDQKSNSNTNQQIVDHSSEPNRHRGDQNKPSDHDPIAHMVTPSDHRIFAEEDEDEPEGEDRGVGDQRNRSEEDREGGADRDENRVVDAEVLGVLLEAEAGGGEGFWAVEDPGGDEFGPWAVTRDGVRDVLD